MKRCATCRVEKDDTEFYRRRAGKTDLSSYCKPCNHIAVARWRRDNRERLRAQRYGMTLAQLLTMYEDQRGLCAVCDVPRPLPDLHIDHCHTSAAVRGLLCSGCNLALGHAADTPRRLRALADYAEAHQ